MSKHYILNDEGDPVQCTLQEWGEFFDDGRDEWALTAELGDYRVSTVFLGADHAFTTKPHVPILWETMVFCDDEDDDWYEYQERYCTLTQAYNGHEAIVKAIKEL